VPLPGAPELEGTERLLSALIRAPSGVAAAISEDAGEPGRSLKAQLHATVRGDAERPAALRLEVYANAYFFRILDCLREDYAALAAALGDDHFHNAVVGYLLAFPSRHPSIRYCGDRLGPYLREHEQAAPLRERFPWAADLADLEWALQGAFDAPEAEALAAEHLARLDPEQWGDLKLRADPAVHWLEPAWPVADVRRAFEGEQPLGIDALTPARETVLVWRRSEQVAYRVLDLDEAQALALVRAGTRFGDVCDLAAHFVGEDEAPGQAATWLSRWIADGCLQRS
jgi:hypothetical protein